MKTKKTALIVSVIVFVSATIWAYGPIGKTIRSCAILEKFVDHVKSGDWLSAKAMLATDTHWFRVEEGKVLYWDHDVTSVISKAEPVFWRTLDYYVTDGSRGEKVVFTASSIADYALLRDGRLIFVKLP